MLHDLKNQVERREKGAYARILAADPTAGKVHSHWLIDLFLKKRLLTADLHKARKYLEAFLRYRNNLKHKDITAYKSLPDLYTAFAKFLPQQPKTPDDLFAPAASHVTGQTWPFRREDVIELYRDKNFLVLIPLSAESATRHGRGTKWCTTSLEEDNRFWNYASEGPLVDVLTYDETGWQKTKYQLHSQSGHFMDEIDYPIEPYKLFENSPVKDAIAAYPALALAMTQSQRRTEKVCLDAVAREGLALAYVPMPLRHAEMCDVAVENDKRAYRYVPRPLRVEKEEMSYLAVMEYGQMLEYMPVPMRTYDVCWEAVGHYGRALSNVPRKIRKLDICIRALSNDISAHGTPWNIDLPETLSKMHEKAKHWGLDCREEGQEAWLRQSLKARVENAARRGQVPNLYDFHWLPNNAQDQFASNLGLRFDDRGIMYIEASGETPSQPLPIAIQDPNGLAI